MSTSIHGHQVIDLLRQQSQSTSRAALLQMVAERYGGQARFHTCALQDPSAAGLLEFLESRGKVLCVDGCLHLQEGEVCQDEG